MSFLYTKYFQLPIINFDLFKGDYECKASLALDFDETKNQLIIGFKKFLMLD
jgi:hypothetical protein